MFDWNQRYHIDQQLKSTVETKPCHHQIGEMRLIEIREATTFEPKTFVYRCPEDGSIATVQVRY